MRRLVTILSIFFSLILITEVKAVSIDSTAGTVIVGEVGNSTQQTLGFSIIPTSTISLCDLTLRLTLGANNLSTPTDSISIFLTQEVTTTTAPQYPFSLFNSDVIAQSDTITGSSIPAWNTQILHKFSFSGISGCPVLTTGLAYQFWVARSGSLNDNSYFSVIYTDHNSTTNRMGARRFGSFDFTTYNTAFMLHVTSTQMTPSDVVTIDDPVPDISGPNYTLVKSGFKIIQGACPTNGTHQILLWSLDYDGNFSSISSTDFDSDNGVDCVNYRYVTAALIHTGLQQITVIDRDWLIVQDDLTPTYPYHEDDRYAEMTVNGYDGVTTSPGWMLSLINPPDNSTHYITDLPSTSSYPFRLAYSVPINIPSSSIVIQLSNPSSTATGTVKNLDPNFRGYVGFRGPVTTSPITYTASIIYGTTTYFSTKFTVLGNTTTLFVPELNDQDFGFWGNTVASIILPDPY